MIADQWNMRIAKQNLFSKSVYMLAFTTRHHYPHSEGMGKVLFSQVSVCSHFKGEVPHPADQRGYPSFPMGIPQSQVREKGYPGVPPIRSGPRSGQGVPLPHPGQVLVRCNEDLQWHVYGHNECTNFFICAYFITICTIFAAMQSTMLIDPSW